MKFPKFVVGLFAVICLVDALPGFEPNSYPQDQLNAWSQACYNFQQTALQTQAAQNHYFESMFPHFRLPPLPFMDICSQIPTYAGGAGHGGAGVSAGAFSTDNRFGGNDGAGAGGPGVHGVSVSSSSLPGGQAATTVTHYGPDGSTVHHYGPGSGSFATGTRFSGSSGQGGDGSYGAASGGYGGGQGSFGTGRPGFASSHKYGGSGGGAAAGSSSFGGNGANFATATRFGDDGVKTVSSYGPHGAEAGISSFNDGKGNVHTNVHKKQY